MANQDITITGNSKVQMALIGGIIAVVAGATGYVVSLKNEQEVHERRITALELNQAQQQEQADAFRIDVITNITEIITKLDFLIDNNIVKKE